MRFKEYIIKENIKKLNDIVPNLAHTGKIKFDSAYKFDKTKNNLLEKDGKNFFKIAKKVR